MRIPVALHPKAQVVFPHNAVLAEELARALQECAATRRDIAGCGAGGRNQRLCGLVEDVELVVEGVDVGHRPHRRRARADPDAVHVDQLGIGRQHRRRFQRRRDDIVLAGGGAVGAAIDAGAEAVILVVHAALHVQPVRGLPFKVALDGAIAVVDEVLAFADLRQEPAIGGGDIHIAVVQRRQLGQPAAIVEGIGIGKRTRAARLSARAPCRRTGRGGGGGAVVIHRQRGLDRVAVIGFRPAQQAVQLEDAAELVAGIQGHFLEAGVQMVQAMLGPQADIGGLDIVQVVGGLVHIVVQQADGARTQDGRIEAGDGAGGVVVGEGFRLQVIFVAHHREVREQRVQGEQRGIVGLILDRACQAQALFMVGDVVIAREARTERLVHHVIVGQRRGGGIGAGLAVGCRGGCGRESLPGRRTRQRGGRIVGDIAQALGGGTVGGCTGDSGTARDQRRGVAGILRGVVVLPAHSGGARLEAVLDLVGRRCQHPQLAAEERVRHQHRAARIEATGHVIVATLERGHQREARLVEGMGRVQVHGGAQRAFLHFGRCGLVHGQLAEQFGREHVEVERTAAIGAAGNIFRSGGGQRLHAVDAHTGEGGVQTAHRDLAALALIARQGDAGNALQRFGHIEVGEFGNVLGQDAVGGIQSAALQVERLFKARTEAVDHHGFHRAAASRLAGRLRHGAPHERAAYDEPAGAVGYHFQVGAPGQHADRLVGVHVAGDGGRAQALHRFRREQDALAGLLRHAAQRVRHGLFGDGEFGVLIFVLGGGRGIDAENGDAAEQDRAQHADA